MGEVNANKNKRTPAFDRNLGFVSSDTEHKKLPSCSPFDMDNTNTYLKVADAVVKSGHHNYEGLRIPLSSGLNWDFLQKNMEEYHDKQLMDYIRFGFPLNINRDAQVENNTVKNHASARNFPEAISDYITIELMFGALIDPFDQPPHENFTWSPLMTWPKDQGRRVILDFSYGDYSVNKATWADQFDDRGFQLKLLHLDMLLPHLEQLGPKASLFKVGIYIRGL